MGWVHMKLPTIITNLITASTMLAILCSCIEIKERVLKYPDGTTRERYTYYIDENDLELKDGIWSKYYPNGQKKERSHWQDGMMHGQWELWYDNGDKKKESNWMYNKKNGIEKMWYQGGQIEYQCMWEEGVRQGIETYWYENGRKKSEVEYLDGKQFGTKMEWEEDEEEILDTIALREEKKGIPDSMEVQKSQADKRDTLNSEKNEAQSTVADSISVAVPRCGYYALAKLKKHGGRCIKVADLEILEAQRLLASTAGLFAEPAAAASLAGMTKVRDLLPANSTIVLLITGSGLKDIEAAARGLAMI